MKDSKKTIFKIGEISDVHSDGKYMDVWFKNGGQGLHAADASCKHCEMSKVVDKCGMGLHVLRHGHVGLFSLWEPDSVGNYNLTAVSTGISDLRDNAHRE